MYLHCKEDFWTNDYHEFRACLGEKELRLFDYIVAKHYEEEGDAMTEMKEVMAFYLEALYPNDLVYCESDDLGHVTGRVFEVPREIPEAVKASLEMPREDLPTEINTKNPITKTIIDWRLKHG